MGKRKAKRKPVKKKVQGKLAKIFGCPICHHEDSIECRMNKNEGLGFLQCRVCSVEYQTPINALSQPVDIFSDWIDEFNKINE